MASPVSLVANQAANDPEAVPASQGGRRRRGSTLNTPLTPEIYAKLIRKHADSTVSSSTFPGNNFRDLANYLNRPYVTSSQSHLSRSSQGPKNEPPLFASLYHLSSTGDAPVFEHLRHPPELQVAHRAFQSGKGSFSSSAGRFLLFLRGHPSPEWLNNVGAHFKVDPEFFQRHLDLNTVPSRSNIFSSPSLPSAASNIIRLRITTLATRATQNQPFEEAAINEARAKADIGMKAYVGQLQRFTADIGSSMVIRFSIHNQDFCSIEQDISITCCKVKDSWTVLAWLDSGKDLDKSLPGPWMSSAAEGYSLKHISPCELLPVIRHHPRIALNSHRFSRSPEAQKEASAGFQQSRSLLNENYGKTLDKATMASDAFYTANDLFSFAAFAEVQFLNLVESVLARETGLAVLSKAPSLTTLIFHKELLELHARQLRENISSLKTRGGLAWPKSSNAEQEQIASDAARLLLHDYGHLLQRCLELSATCDRGMMDFNHKASLLESTKANSLGESVEKLTKIATLLSFMYVPLSFTTSFFGMNFADLGQGSLRIWIWFAVSVPVLVVSFAALWAHTRMPDSWGGWNWLERLEVRRARKRQADSV